MSIQDAADRVGLTIDTLRYYERAGLLNQIVRTSGGQRRYQEANLGGIVFVTKMRATGMPIRRIREYMEAPIQSDGSSPEKRKILVAHRESIEEKMKELQEALTLIDRKIDLYDSNGLGCRPA